jgi:phosphofructokinase-like protein
MKRIAMLTGGGDCPGLNAVIRGVTRRALKEGWDVIGFRNGWAGAIGNDIIQIDRERVAGILHLGGTILGTSRTNPTDDQIETIVANINKDGIDALVAIGGDDTLSVALRLHKKGVPIIGCPKTIDNDIGGTDQTFGFDTAVNIATEAIDRLHSTAEAHSRVLVVEVMGRQAGWIALYAGVAGGADVVLLPEFPMSLANICKIIKGRQANGKNFSIVAVAEGFKIEGEDVTTQTKELDAFGHVRLGGIADHLCKVIERETGIESRSVVLGHVQRGGTPTAYDRVLATRFGVNAADAAHAGEYGVMVSLRGQEIGRVALADAVRQLKLVPQSRYDDAAAFFG